jgi:tubulin--tyrosine ligase
MLLAGQRKFDVRCWVLVDASFRVYVHCQGVLRTTSVPFTIDSDRLKDKFVHLSNHCIQTKAEDYGKYESTNEMFFQEFGEFLKEHHSCSLEDDVVPQFHRIVALTMFAARDQMEGVPGQSFGSFNLFGYDFMLDEDARVHLLEINSSPAVADALLEEITRDVVNVAVLPFFEDESGVSKGGGEGEGSSSSSNGFQRVQCEQWMSKMDKSRVWLPHER